MKALVTGATGFIGSHLVDHLLRKGYAVRVLLRTTSDTVWLKDLPVETVTGDLFNREALRTAVRDVDYVYHSAGLTKAKTTEGYFTANATGTQTLLAAVVEHAPRIRRFIHVSSQAAAGPSPDATPITEDTPPRPITSYGRSKWESERACHRVMDMIPVTIVRPPAVYGPRDRDVFEFFHTMSRGLQPMIGFHDKTVSLIHVTDLVRGFVMAGEHEAAKGRTYFITSGTVYGWREIGDVTREALGTRTLRVRIPVFGVYVVAAIAEALAAFSAKPALINIEKARDMVQDRWTCDGTRAKQELGFEAAIPLPEGVRETVAWYRAKGWLK